MVKNSLIIIAFAFLNMIYNLDITENEYSITLADEKMTSSNYIRPVISDNGFLYIVTGELSDKIDDFTPGDSVFLRYIYKFNINTGVLFERYFFKSIYPFRNAEVIFAGNNLQYLLTTTLYSIEFNNGQKSKEMKYDLYGYRRSLKKAGTYYYYSHMDYENRSNMIIKKMELINISGDDLPSYQIIKTSNPIKVLYYHAIVSCDLTKDNNNILCVYYSEDKYVYLSIFNNNLDLINEEKYEEVGNAVPDYFIKIVYFKENSKFVVVNSQNEYITRLRYFNYINNRIISQLYTIINNGNNYIDIDETQLGPHQFENDIIATDSDKIIKIYCGSDKIIISVFQFYNHDTLLFIKIYNLFGFDKIGFHDFTQPRIAMFRNSLVVCLSLFNIDRQKTGFFFINYPDSKEFKITQNNNIIKIDELISLKNNLFSLNLKFKVLKIPKDFIFINLKSKEIKEDDELEINDILKLRQYRIKEGDYILKYEGIAIGNDLGYSSSKIYPTSKSIPETSEIYIEGRQGNITINLDDCLDGYYHLDYDLNLCTNIKPKGYYLDKNERTYKSCQSPCEECSGPIINNTFMNCVTCIQNYFITEDTNSCYNGEVENYYLDKDIYRRCHPRCSKCITGSKDDKNMSCLECMYNIEEPYFYKIDTQNCILPSEFIMREKISLTISTNFAFIIFTVIFIISLIISFFIFCCSLCFKKNNENNNIIGQTKVEMADYEKINNEDRKENE